MRYEQIGHRIEALCEKRGWSLYKLAQESNIAYSTLYDTKNGLTVPQVDLIQKICDGFNITMSDFFKEEDDGVLQLSDDDILIVNCAKELDSVQRARALAYMQGLKDMNNIY